MISSGGPKQHLYSKQFGYVTVCFASYTHTNTHIHIHCIVFWKVQPKCDWYLIIIRYTVRSTTRLGMTHWGQANTRVRGRGWGQGLQVSKQSETHLYWIGELLFVTVLIDFLKQIFTELRGRERSGLVQINSMWRGEREDEEEGDLTNSKQNTNIVFVHAV